jgi:hypothetical protein
MWESPTIRREIWTSKRVLALQHKQGDNSKSIIRIHIIFMLCQGYRCAGEVAHPVAGAH